MAKLSKYFTWEEASISQTADRLGIDNSIPPELRANVIETAKQMDRVRDGLGSAIIVTSWYRSPALNTALGSKSTSQHILGTAVDFISPRYGKPYQVCKRLIKDMYEYNWDQLILEHSWIHISFSLPNGVARNQVLSLLKDGSFKKGLCDEYGISY